MDISSLEDYRMRVRLRHDEVTLRYFSPEMTWITSEGNLILLASVLRLPSTPFTLGSMVPTLLTNKVSNDGR